MLSRFIKGFCCRSHHNLATTECSKLPESISLFLQKHSKSKSLSKCRQIHAKLILSDIISSSDIYTTNTLINFYIRCADLYHAHHLFDQTPQKNVVTWTSIISSYIHHGFPETSLNLFKDMIQSGENPNQFTLSVTIRACIKLNFLKLGLQIHRWIIGFGYEREEFAGSSLVDMYFKISGNLDEACKIFHGLYCRDSVTWNVMISGFAQIGEFHEVMRLFTDMRVVDGLSPNDFTLTSLLKCCGGLEEVEQIHGLVLKSGAELDVVVGSALVDLYGKCGSVDSGRRIMDSMGEKDGYVWSSVISGYSRNDCGEAALLLFRDMIRQGVQLDQHALSSALKACVKIGGTETGIQAHAQMIKHGYQRDCFVASVLITLYVDCCEVGEAEKVFRRISDRDIVSWNSMIMGYAQMEDEGSSLSCIKLYRELRSTTMLKPNGATLVAVLQACRSKEDIEMGLQIHGEIVKSSHGYGTLIGNAVINMYSKCEAVEDAHKAFRTMVIRDEISWNSIIGNYTQNGYELEALKLCNEMLAQGFRLSSFSLPSCIAACSGLAAMDLGKQFHSLVIRLGFEEDVYVGSSIIDMYAKCGSMENSIRVFNEQQEQNVVTFNTLISGFAQHGKVREAIETFEVMEKMNLSPNKITFLAVLSACSHAGLVEESLFLFDLMTRKYGIEPGSEHYSCLVDVFGRAGRLKEAHQLIQKGMGLSAWRTLLSACRNYGDMVIGERTAKRVMELSPEDHSSYVLMSNLYSGLGRWEEALQLRKQMREIGVKKDPGSSWLIIRDWVHKFTAGDVSQHPEIEKILREVNILNQQIMSIDSPCSVVDRWSDNEHRFSV